MELGLVIPDFTWPAGQAKLGSELADIVRIADDVGFTRISVMDHFWQIPLNGPKEHEMLEAYTTLGFIAAHTKRAQLLTVVTGATYREPGLLAKALTTLDVLSGGRASLGIGAGWNEEEARGLGLNLPSLSERFERLEECVQICLQMWSDDDGPYRGRYYQLESTLNQPQSLSRPHPPILIGGAGERKTLKLVAKYADACNIFDGQDIAHKLRVLAEHCENEGRDYEAIEKTTTMALDVGANGENTAQVLDRLRGLHEVGIQTVYGSAPDVYSLAQLQIIGRDVIPELASWS